MNWRAIRAIMGKDLRVVFQSKAVSLPLIIVPLFVVILIPGTAAAIPLSYSLVGGTEAVSSDLAGFLQQMPTGLQDRLGGYTDLQAVFVLMSTYLFAPLYLILPLMVSSVIAADSFAGEKERKTLEALLYSPTSDGELLTAKLLAAWVPAVLVAILSFLLYALLINSLAWPVMEHIFFPNLMWLILVLWVAPATAAMGLGATVLVSARVRTFQEAYQLGGFVVIPIVALMISQVAGIVYLSEGFVWLVGLAFWLVAALLLWLGSRTLRRNELMTRL